MVERESKGRQLHNIAAQLRENGQFPESIAKAREAQYAYFEVNNLAGAAEAMACEAITWRVAAGLLQNRKMLEQAEAVMIHGVQLAQQSKDPTALALPMYQLAEIREDLGQHENALHTYKQAIGHMRQDPPPSHNRPSVLADMKIHMYICAYKAGDKSVLDKVLQALAELENNPDPDDFNQHVWMSGGYMRLATILRKDDPGKAYVYLQEAKRIIDSDTNLKNRRDQWEKLAAQFV